MLSSRKRHGNSKRFIVDIVLLSVIRCFGFLYGSTYLSFEKDTMGRPQVQDLRTTLLKLECRSVTSSMNWSALKILDSGPNMSIAVNCNRMLGARICIGRYCFSDGIFRTHL